MSMQEQLLELHDASLESVVFRWADGELVLQLRSAGTASRRMVLVAHSVRKLACTRLLPWGPSVSINEVRGPSPTADLAASVVEVEMQSGDVICIEASAFHLDPAT